MTIKEKLNAAKQRQQQILDASKAAGNDKLTESEQREFDEQQNIINALSEINVEESDARSEGVKAENKRIHAISELGRSFGLDVSDYIKDTNMTVDKARAAILETLKKSGTGIPAQAKTTSKSGAEEFRSAASDALILKSGMKIEKATDGANELRNFSLRDLARKSLIIDGRDANEVLGFDDEALLRSFYNPESSFPAILDNAIKKSIVEAYKTVPTTFDKWTSKGSLSDFKESKDREYLLGSFSEFKEVKENGEIEHDTINSAKMPTRQLKSYAKSFTMTRKAFIDDDIGFISALPAKFTAAAKMTIEKQVYSLLFNNTSVFDNKALFHADHKNIISTGTAPTQAAIQAAINLGRKQKNPFNETIFWNPKTLIVPVGYEFDLAVIFKSAQVTGSNNNDINPLYNYPLEIVQVPMLNTLAGENACPWFLVADSNTCGGIQVDYLNGQEVPSIRRMETPGKLGFQWDVWLDWGINVRDFRGIVRNNGVALS